MTFILPVCLLSGRLLFKVPASCIIAISALQRIGTVAIWCHAPPQPALADLETPLSWFPVSGVPKNLAGKVIRSFGRVGSPLSAFIAYAACSHLSPVPMRIIVDDCKITSTFPSSQRCRCLLQILLFLNTCDMILILIPMLSPRSYRSSNSSYLRPDQMSRRRVAQQPRRIGIGYLAFYE